MAFKLSGDSFGVKGLFHGPELIKLMFLGIRPTHIFRYGLSMVDMPII